VIARYREPKIENLATEDTENTERYGASFLNASSFPTNATRVAAFAVFLCVLCVLCG